MTRESNAAQRLKAMRKKGREKVEETRRTIQVREKAFTTAELEARQKQERLYQQGLRTGDAAGQRIDPDGFTQRRSAEVKAQAANLGLQPDNTPLPLPEDAILGAAEEPSPDLPTPSSDQGSDTQELPRVNAADVDQSVQLDADGNQTFGGARGMDDDAIAAARRRIGLA